MRIFRLHAYKVNPFLNLNIHILIRIFLLSISITCGFLIDSLEKCCQHIAMVLDTGFEDSEWTELDHLLGYYKMEGLYNQVFSYKQKTLRHNIFLEGNGSFPPKMIPVFLKIYQVITMRQILSSLCIIIFLAFCQSTPIFAAI